MLKSRYLNTFGVLCTSALKSFEVAPRARREEIGRYGAVWSRTSVLERSCRRDVGRFVFSDRIVELSSMILFRKC